MHMIMHAHMCRCLRDKGFTQFEPSFQHYIAQVSKAWINNDHKGSNEEAAEAPFPICETIGYRKKKKGSFATVSFKPSNNLNNDTNLKGLAN